MGSAQTICIFERDSLSSLCSAFWKNRVSTKNWPCSHKHSQRIGRSKNGLLKFKHELSQEVSYTARWLVPFRVNVWPSLLPPFVNGVTLLLGVKPAQFFEIVVHNVIQVLCSWWKGIWGGCNFQSLWRMPSPFFFCHFFFFCKSF